MNTKNELRITAKNLRNSLDVISISKILVEKIKNNELFNISKNIMLYYPIKNEFNLLNLCKTENKNFFLPKMHKNSLLVCPYKYGEMLESANFNVQEPLTAPVAPSKLDLIIVPALLVDRNNYRLGYGKGFYDRFLKETNAKTIVAISEKLIIDKLPIEPNDKKIDVVLTEQKATIISGIKI